MALCCPSNDGGSAHELPILTPDELYASKRVAAMDRQRPRDLFDVWQLHQSGGITDAMVECFVTYLAGHNRPTHEVVFGNDRDITTDYHDGFVGMTQIEVSLAEDTPTARLHIDPLLMPTDFHELRVRECSKTMPTHFCHAVSKRSQRCGNTVLRHRPVRMSKLWEDPSSATRVHADLAQERNCHGHSVLTMLSVYAAWTEGSLPADSAAIRRAMRGQPTHIMKTRGASRSALRETRLGSSAGNGPICVDTRGLLEKQQRTQVPKTSRQSDLAIDLPVVKGHWRVSRWKSRNRIGGADGTRRGLLAKRKTLSDQQLAVFSQFDVPHFPTPPRRWQ